MVKAKVPVIISVCIRIIFYVDMTGTNGYYYFKTYKRLLFFVYINRKEKKEENRNLTIHRCAVGVMGLNV